MSAHRVVLMDCDDDKYPPEHTLSISAVPDGPTGTEEAIVYFYASRYNETTDSEIYEHNGGGIGVHLEDLLASLSLVLNAQVTVVPYVKEASDG